MTEKISIIKVTFQFTVLIVLLCDFSAYVNSNFVSDYRSLLRNLVEKDHGYAHTNDRNELQHLLLTPEVDEQRSRFPFHKTRDNGGLPIQDYIDEPNLGYITTDNRNEEQITINSDSDIQSDDEMEAPDEFTKPSLSKLLNVISELKIPAYKSVVPEKAKRAGWAGNPGFGALVNAVYNLNRDEDDTKTESRRFHPWGG